MKKTFVFIFGIIMMFSLVSAFGFNEDTLFGFDSLESSTTYTGNLTNLSEMQDVNVIGVADGEILSWDAETSKWIPIVVSDFSESDPKWTANQSSYSTTADILSWNYYNSTDFSISDYALLSTLNNGSYLNYDWNSTGLIINWSYLTDDVDLSGYVPYTDASSNLVLGNNNFSVGGSDFFVDNNDGKVGIGIGSPTHDLTVYGESGLKFFDGNGGGVEINPWGNGVNFNPVTSGKNIYFGRDTTMGNLIVQSGNVGIGTTSPGAKLNIVGSDTPKIEIQNTGGLYTGIDFISTGGTGKFELYSGNMQFLGSNDIRFFSGGSNERVRITSSGKVGIGTDSPIGKLAVDSLQSSTAFTGTSATIYASNSDQTNNNYVRLNFGDGDSNAASSMASQITDHAKNYGNLEFWTRGSDGFSNKMIIEENGNVGIGTTSPSYPLEVSGSASGITAYFENNISAEDYLYHSPFPSSTYTKEQALNDLIKVNGENGKINHSSVPSNAISSQTIPIYEENTSIVQSITQEPIYENYTYEEEVCEYKQKLLSNEYEYECEKVLKEGIRIKQICHNETQYNYIQNENTTTFSKVPEIIEVCEDVYENVTTYENVTDKTQIGTRDELQTSVGMMLGNIILSIQKLFNWNTEQDNRIKMLEDELCKKDNTYDFCLGEVQK